MYFKTSDLGTSDCFLKNKPKVFGLSQLPNLATTDHYVTLTTYTTSTPSQSRTEWKLETQVHGARWAVAYNERLIAGSQYYFKFVNFYTFITDL